MGQIQNDLIRAFVEAMPASDHLGIRIEDLGERRAILEMDTRPELTFDGTVVQGGIVGVLADYAAVSACGTAMPDGWLMATMGCETHNLAPAAGKRLIAVAEVLRAGKRHAVARADVYNDSVTGTHCLTGLFTATGIPPKRPAAGSASCG